MNPKAQLRYLMEITLFNNEHSEADVKENLLLGVVSCKGDTAVLSDSINSIEITLPSRSVSKKRSKIEPGLSLEPHSLYIFNGCKMRMIEAADSLSFELTFKNFELVMPFYFVTKDKNFKPLSVDLSLKDHSMLKRKVI